MAQESDSRLIRVFVSSTFRDMQAERDLLATEAFPRLDRMCQRRGLRWREIDLRWGVTREQVERGEALAICLEEVEQCQPWFLCLLGERYGYVPELVDPDLIERWPWLKPFQQSSITEMEIRHAILGNPKTRERALIFFRDPAFVVGLPEGVDRDDFIEGDPALVDRLAQLKADLQNDLPHCFTYSDPAELSALVEEKMGALIAERYPAEPVDPEVEEERLQAQHLDHVLAEAGGANVDTSMLSAWLATPDESLVIEGEEGSGKTVLLATLVKSLQIAEPQAERARGIRALFSRKPREEDDALTRSVFTHFIQATERSSQWQTIARRIIQHVADAFSVELENPEEAGELRPALANALNAVPKCATLVLAIDGLDRLEEAERAQDLGWLPLALPDNVTLLASTNTGTARDALRRRELRAASAEPLHPEAIRSSAQQFLSEYGKTLAAEPMQTIADLPAAANPLFLRLLVEELRLTGTHETLEQQLSELGQAGDLPDLLNFVLQRCEDRFEANCPGIVQDACIALSMSRFGVTETDLLTALSRDDAPLPQAIWSPIQLNLQHLLRMGSGALTIAHEAFREAIKRRYGSSGERHDGLARRLARALAKRADHDVMATREAVRLYLRVQAWPELASLLGNPERLVAFGHASFFELSTAVRALQDAGGIPAPTIVEDILRNPPMADKEALNYASNLMLVNGHGHLALAPMEELLQRAKGQRNIDMQLLIMDRISVIYEELGELQASYNILKEQELIARGNNRTNGVAVSLLNQFTMLVHNHPREAFMLLDQAKALAEQDGDEKLLGVLAGNEGEFVLRDGHAAEALPMFLHSEEACRRAGDEFQLVTALERKARAYAELGRAGEARSAILEALSICDLLGEKEQASAWRDKWANIIV